MRNNQYALDVIRDMAALTRGEKPLVIVSEGKDTTSYEWVGGLDSEWFELRFVMLTCEDGELHEHVFACAKGAPYADEAIAAIQQNRWFHDRVRLQTTIGHLLGYRAGDIAEFLLSDVARTCPCDCCGGPNTVEPPVKHGEFDQNVRRTMYHA